MWPKHERKIPTLVALFLLTLIVGSAAYITEQRPDFLSRAKIAPVGIQPNAIRITNVTDTAFTVSWTTTEPVAGIITALDANRNKRSYYDERDTDAIPKAYQLHYVTVNGFDPGSTVVYSIESGTYTFTQTPVKLFSPLGETGSTLPLYGDIPSDNNTQEVMVVITITNSQPLSTLVVNRQNWTIPIAQSRIADGLHLTCSQDFCTDETPVRIEFVTVKGSSKIETILTNVRPYLRQESERLPINKLEMTKEATSSAPSSSQKSQPTPAVEGAATTIVPTTTPTNIPIPTRTPTATRTPTPTGTPTPAASNQVSIIAPPEGAVITFPKPLMRGSGIAGKSVILTISGTIKQVGKTIVGTDELWQWTPGYPLSSGSYTLSIETVDKSGRKTIMTRRFTILKSGEQVLSDSTPSATIVPTETTIPQIQPTTIPTPASLIPTPTATLITPIPITGSGLPGILLIGGGGALLLFALTLL